MRRQKTRADIYNDIFVFVCWQSTWLMCRHLHGDGTDIFQSLKRQMDAGESTPLCEDVSHLRRQIRSRRCHSLRQVSHPALCFLRGLFAWSAISANDIWAFVCPNMYRDARTCDTYVSFGSSSLNMCTVSVLLEQQSHIESILKDRLFIVTHLLTPRRNSNSFVPSWTWEDTRAMSWRWVGVSRGYTNR